MNYKQISFLYDYFFYFTFIKENSTRSFYFIESLKNSKTGNIRLPGLILIPGTVQSTAYLYRAEHLEKDMWLSEAIGIET